MDDPMLNRLRRSPFSGGDLGSVFGQLDTIASAPMSANEDLGVTPEVADYIHNGLVNSTFTTPPPDTSVDIDDITNKLPGWSLTTIGTKITARWVATDSGGKIQFTMATGGSPTDSALFTQLVPVTSSYSGFNVGRPFILSPWLGHSAGSTGSGNVSLDGQYLKADGTTTGAASSITSSTASADSIHLEDVNGNNTATATSAFFRYRFGFVRDPSADSATEVISVLYTALDHSTPFVTIPDVNDMAGSYSSLSKQNDQLFVVGNGQTSLYDSVIMNGVIYASVTADKNDYAPAGWQTCSTLVLDPDAARNITGFEAPTGTAQLVQGTIKHIYNIDSAFAITLVHASGSSSSNNQIYGPSSANITIVPRGGVTLMWFGDSGGAALRWRLVSGD